MLKIGNQSFVLERSPQKILLFDMITDAMTASMMLTATLKLKITTTTTLMKGKTAKKKTKENVVTTILM